MIYFYSPFFKCKERIKELEKFEFFYSLENNYKEIDNIKDSLYLIYDRPNNLIKDLIENCINVKSISDLIANGYKEINEALKKENTYAISKDRLDAISNDDMIKLKSKNFDINIELEEVETEYLYTFLTNSIFQINPNLLDYYLDIELKALLFNTEADSSYYEYLKDKSQYKDELIHQIINPSIDKNFLIDSLKSDLNKSNLKFNELSLKIKHLDEKQMKLSNYISELENDLKKYKRKNRYLHDNNDLVNNQLTQLDKDLNIYFTRNIELEELIEEYKIKLNSSIKIIQKLYNKIKTRKRNFIFNKTKFFKIEKLLPFNIDN